MENKLLNKGGCLIVVLAAILVSCSGKGEEVMTDTFKAVLSLNFSEGDVENNRETVKTIRFITFKNSTSNPEVDINKYVEIAPADQKPVSEIGASELVVTANNDILVAVIINEPQRLTTMLNVVYTTTDLENMVFNLSDILNADGEISDMPMIGVIRDISIIKDQRQEKGMIVERAVAKVEVYLEATPGGVGTGYTSESSVTVHNLSYDSYFAMGNVGNETRDNTVSSKNFGHVMTNVPTVTDRVWVPTTTEYWSYQSGKEVTNKRLLCSFYMAERIFKTDFSDRIAISMTNIKRATMETGITKKNIEEIVNEGVSQPFTEIRRNNVYQITAKVGQVYGLSFTVEVEPWTPSNVDIPIN